jgi:hypothetical protein
MYNHADDAVKIGYDQLSINKFGHDDGDKVVMLISVLQQGWSKDLWLMMLMVAPSSPH